MDISSLDTYPFYQLAESAAPVFFAGFLFADDMSVDSTMRPAPAMPLAPNRSPRNIANRLAHSGVNENMIADSVAGTTVLALTCSHVLPAETITPAQKTNPKLIASMSGVHPANIADIPPNIPAVDSAACGVDANKLKTPETAMNAAAQRNWNITLYDTRGLDLK